MELLESQEKPRRRLLGLGVALPEPGERADSDRRKAVRLAPDVHDLFERGPPARVQEQMRQEEVGQVVHLPVQLVTVRRSEEHTSELQSLTNLVCRLLLEKKKKHQDKSLCTIGCHA